MVPVHLLFQVELSKYERGISWLHELLTCTQFTAERVKVVATKIVNDVAQLKRSGRFVTKTLIIGLIFNKGKICNLICTVGIMIWYESHNNSGFDDRFHVLYQNV